MTLALLRFPGTAYPLVPSGNEAIDRYLMALDRQLIGGAEVRKLTLVELKDHLLRRKALEKDRGATDPEAGEIAARELGPIEVHAREQRRGIGRRFLRVWLVATLWFCVFSALMGLAAFPVTPALVAALLAAWCRAFLNPSRSLPLGTVDADHVVVTLRPEDRDLFVLVGLFSGCWTMAWAALTACFVVALHGRSVATIRMEVGFGLIGILPSIGVFLPRFCQTLEVTPAGIERRRWLRTEHIAFAQLVDVRRLGRLPLWWVPMSFVFRVIPDWTPWQETLVVEHATDHGKRRRFYVHPDAVNVDQLAVILEAKLRAVRGAAGLPAASPSAG